jgi:hypothetical protein
MHWQCWLVGGALQMTENDAGMQWRYCFSLDSLLLVFALHGNRYLLSLRFIPTTSTTQFSFVSSAFNTYQEAWVLASS